MLTTSRQTDRPSAWRAAARGSWLVPLAIFVVSRVTSGAWMAYLGRGQRSAYAPHDLQIPLAVDPATYLNLLTNWDGQWYARIAEQGYPTTLPTVDGAVVENVWAFYPLYPGIVGALGRLGLPFALAATIVSTVCAGLAMVLLYHVLRTAAGRFTAALTVTAFCFGPTSVVLQAAYTESLALLEVLAALWALSTRRYAWSAVCVALLAFTRPLALPLAAVIGVTWLLRLRKRHEDPFPRRELVTHGLLALGAAASFVLWPALCGFVTGEPDAYARTQRAWLSDDPGWTTWLSPLVTGHDGMLLVLSVPFLLLVTWLACRRAAAVWGPELRAWAVLYPLFILAVSRPTTSIFRYLALGTVTAWPLPDLSARVRSTRGRVALLAAVAATGFVLQYFWIEAFWVITDRSITGIP